MFDPVIRWFRSTRDLAARLALLRLGSPSELEREMDGRVQELETLDRHVSTAQTAAREAREILEAAAEPADRAPVPDLPPDRCVIIPHSTEKPGPLAIDLHSAVLAVLQRAAYRDAVDLRDPLDVVTLRRDGPAGPTYATIVRWYAVGERPMAELLVDPPAPEPLPPEALPRMDAGVSYVPVEPRT